MPAPLLGYALMAGASLLPKLIDMFGEQDQRTGFERGIEAKLKGIIDQGGLGLNPGQLNTRYQQMYQQLLPMFRGQQESLTANQAGRGIYKSGVGLQQSQQLGQQQSQQMVNLLQNLQQWNEEQKMNSLMQALGMGAQVGGRAGDIQRFSQAQNQGSFNQMYASMLGMAADKGLFDF